MNQTRWHAVEWVRKLWRERRPMLIAGIVFLVGLPIVLWLSPSKDPEVAPALDEAFQQAEAANVTGDYGSALTALTGAEEQAETTEEKIRLYSEIAAAASNTGDLDKALKYYDMKHQLDPESKGADGHLVGVIYERQGDSARALEYYRLYHAYLEALPQDETVAAKIGSIKETIAQLEGAAQR